MEREEEKQASGLSDDDETTSFSRAVIPNLAAESIKAPMPMDVICGRGKSVSHPGNQRFRKLVAERKEEYQRAKRRDDKTKITFEIVEELRRGNAPSRFLLKDAKSQMWYDAGDEYAREKVSHALRSRPTDERRKRPKPKKKTPRKSQYTPELEETVQSLIKEQQELLKSMIEKEVFPVGHVSF